MIIIKRETVVKRQYDFLELFGLPKQYPKIVELINFIVAASPEADIE